MKILANPFRFALFALALPAALTFSSCDDDDDNKGPQQGRVLISHSAASANFQVKALVNDREVGQLNYGQNSSYLNVNVGSPTLKINVASSNQTAVSQEVPVAANQAYSVFAYANTATTVRLLPVADDLTAPASGQAKIRVVHLGLDAPSPVKLSENTIGGVVDVPSISVAFPTASPFVSIPAGNRNLLITTGPISTQVLAVGDGTGTGTGTKNYEAGKIYTIVVRGINLSLNQALQPKAVVITNN
jgi:hypothetical protein